MGNERIPALTDDVDYQTWKKEVAIWELGTQASAKQRAARLIGFMDGKAHDAAIQIPATQLGTDTGVEALIGALDKLFLEDTTQCLFQNPEQLLSRTVFLYSFNSNHQLSVMIVL